MGRSDFFERETFVGADAHIGPVASAPNPSVGVDDTVRPLRRRKGTPPYGSLSWGAWGRGPCDRPQVPSRKKQEAA